MMMSKIIDKKITILECPSCKSNDIWAYDRTDTISEDTLEFNFDKQEFIKVDTNTYTHDNKERYYQCIDCQFESDMLDPFAVYGV